MHRSAGLVAPISTILYHDMTPVSIRLFLRLVSVPIAPPVYHNDIPVGKYAAGSRQRITLMNRPPILFPISLWILPPTLHSLPNTTLVRCSRCIPDSHSQTCTTGTVTCSLWYLLERCFLVSLLPSLPLSLSFLLSSPDRLMIHSY